MPSWWSSRRRGPRGWRSTTRATETGSSGSGSPGGGSTWKTGTWWRATTARSAINRWNQRWCQKAAAKYRYLVVYPYVSTNNYPNPLCLLADGKIYSSPTTRFCFLVHLRLSFSFIRYERTLLGSVNVGHSHGITPTD